MYKAVEHLSIHVDEDESSEDYGAADVQVNISVRAAMAQLV
jgi:hypothetical protein